MARKLCKFNVRRYEFTSGCRRPRPRPRYLKVPSESSASGGKHPRFDSSVSVAYFFSDEI